MPSRQSTSGREALTKVWKWSGGPHGGPEDVRGPLGDAAVVGGPSRRFGGPSQRYGSEREAR